MAVYEDKILRELTVENLSEAIADVINDDPKRVAEDIQNFLYPRLDFICDPSYHIFFLFEKCYIETEWKDMISVHYINTSYNVKNAVMRVHLFFSDTVDEKKYAGCFTLRTIDDVRFMLSYIWPLRSSNHSTISRSSPVIYAFLLLSSFLVRSIRFR